jgi:hypothetical protein
MTEIDRRARVEFLLQYCDPEGETAARLKRIRGLIDQNAFLSLASIKFIDQLYRELLQNIACRHYTDRGNCKVQDDAPCEYLDLFSNCPEYDEAPPEREKLGGY